jgi:hypothetical protein
MKKQSNPQLVLALIVLVGFVLLLVDSIRTSPLTFTFAKEPPLPVISNDPDGHMPYAWELDPVDNDYNPHWFADHFHVPVYVRYANFSFGAIPRSLWQSGSRKLLP